MKTLKICFVNFLKISFCRREHSSLPPNARKALGNFNHSVLIVASIKSLINVFENVLNFSLVGEKKRAAAATAVAGE